jgi:hypothetical protein
VGRSEEHQNGWFIECDGQAIAELEFMRLDGFSWLFRLEPLLPEVAATALLSELSDKKRPPGSRFCYRNRRTSAIATDRDFMFGYSAGAHAAAIRDMRPLMADEQPRWYGRLWQWWTR